jgi:hypothetical protein
MASIAAGTYNLKKFFLPAIVETLDTWNKLSKYLIAYWKTQGIGFSLLKINGEMYINITSAIAAYVKMPSPLKDITETKTEVWVESVTKEEITGDKLTDWNNFKTSAGLTSANIEKGFYSSDLADMKMKLETAKRSYFNKYGDYPEIAEKTTYA